MRLSNGLDIRRSNMSVVLTAWELSEGLDPGNIWQPEPILTSNVMTVPGQLFKGVCGWSESKEGRGEREREQERQRERQEKEEQKYLKCLERT
jgi:hypothetical protein